MMLRPAALCLMLLASPLRAEPGDVEEGADMLSDGARLLLRGLAGQLEPALAELLDALKDLKVEGLGIGDLGRYQAPEVLPNGDIILRRKRIPPEPPELLPDPPEPRDAPPDPAPPDPDGDGVIEL